MEEKEDQGVEHQMFSYIVQMESSPSGTKVVTVVDSLYVGSLPPTSQPSIRGFWDILLGNRDSFVRHGLIINR